MTAAALRPKDDATPSIVRPDASSSIFTVAGRDALFIRAGAEIGMFAFGEETPVALPALVVGTDYAVLIDTDGHPSAVSCADGVPADAIGGFHFAPGGNAAGRNGGDEVPAINPWSCWDSGFRPACPDPRGMALVDLPGGARYWVDIYKLGVSHLDNGTSRHGVTIADGADRPQKVGGSGHYPRLDYATAVEVYAHHGKQLLTYDEFRAAAFGVTEKSSAARDPKVTGLDAARTSRRGIMQATGNLWDWGTDGDPDEPRPSIFGGSWVNGRNAGSRSAILAHWPNNSDDSLSARGRSDHVT